MRLRGIHIEDEERYAALIERHRGLVERLCLWRSHGDWYLCDELRQECYCALWRYLPALREGVDALQERAWVVLHCRGVFSHYGRRRDAKNLDPLERTDFLQSLDDNDETLLLHADDGGDDLADMVAEYLTDYECRAFRLLAEGFTLPELAERLGIETESAARLRRRIIVKLQKHYKIDHESHE
ncbi:MAG: sigma-70 family RNA polymerase sigma factor [Bacteroidales bacterium]|nr:sigma-70 family RNA polymerase sigma factor [Bacteroidales bacterium]